MADRNRLGDFTFVQWARSDNPAAPPILTAQKTQIVERAGVKGTGLLLTGERGVPFEMVSGVDNDSLEAGLDTLTLYQGLIGQDAQNLWWGGVNYRTAYNTVFLVVDCVPLECRKVTGAAGGLSSQRGAWIRALWTLVAVPFSSSNLV